MKSLALIVCAVVLAACGGDSSSNDDGGGSGDGGSGDGGVGQVSDFVFDESQVRTYEITLADTDWQWLQDNALAEQYVPANLSFGGFEWSNVGLRYKGEVGSLQNQGPIDALRPCFNGGVRNYTNCPKLGMKLKASEYDPDTRIYTLKRIQFHSMGNDATKMVERLSYWLFRQMGVFAPRLAHARLIINGEFQGLFAVVEQIDGRFVRERMPEGGEGNLYKEVWPVHSTEQPYLDALRTNRDEAPSAAKMVRFAADLAAADDSTWVQTLEAWTDVDMLVAKMAVDRAIEHWDGIVAWYCVGGPCFNHNYYWYESTVEDKVWMIPWDVDRAMVWPPPIRTLYGMPDWDEDTGCQLLPLFFAGLTGQPPHCNKFVGSTARTLWDRYTAKTQELLDGPFQLATLNAKVDEYSTQLAPYIDEDPAIDRATWDAAVVQFRADLASMRTSIEQKIAP